MDQVLIIALLTATVLGALAVLADRPKAQRIRIRARSRR